MLKTIRERGITLALSVAGSTGLTAAISQMTETTIAEQTSLQQKMLLDRVLPTERYSNAPAQNRYPVAAPELGKGEHRVYTAKQGDRPAAAVLEAIAPDDYSGAIQLLVGADFSGTVLGTHVTEYHEAPGLDDKIELCLSDQITCLADKKTNDADDTNWAVKKDGGNFDQFTGVTITPRAMANVVKRAGLYAQTLPTQLSQLPACGEQNVSEIKDVTVQGLWKSNSALVQLLDLCPLLAVTSIAINTLGLGPATTLVLTPTNLTISTLCHWTPAEIRIPIYAMIIASVVSVARMLINTYTFGLYQSLGIFIPLIVTNCIVVGRAETFVAKGGSALPALDGFSIDMDATCVMFVLGSLREIIGNGTSFDGADVLLGSWTKVLRTEIFHINSPSLLAMLPPGAFIGLGLMLAGKYLIDEKMEKHRTEAVAGCALPNGETGNV